MRALVYANQIAGYRLSSVRLEGHTLKMRASVRLHPSMPGEYVLDFEAR